MPFLNNFDNLELTTHNIQQEMSTIEKVQEDVLVEEQVGINNEIVLYNDDVNTFDHVIDTLIRVCQHSA